MFVGIMIGIPSTSSYTDSVGKPCNGWSSGIAWVLTMDKDIM